MLRGSVYDTVELLAARTSLWQMDEGGKGIEKSMDQTWHWFEAWEKDSFWIQYTWWKSGNTAKPNINHKTLMTVWTALNKKCFKSFLPVVNKTHTIKKHSVVALAKCVALHLEPRLIIFPKLKVYLIVLMTWLFDIAQALPQE